MRLGKTLIAATAFAVAALSCGRHDSEPRHDPDVLVIIGDTALTLNDVVAKIPPGLEPDDSTSLFAEIVDDWIAGELLEDVASRTLPDLDRIDRMVAQYRRRLIVNSYKQVMRESRRPNVNADSIDSYWRRFGKEMILEEPLVKGIYIKLPERSVSLPEIREMFADGSTESIDRLEKENVSEAIHYDNFSDRWIEWSKIASQLPYRFYDADAFLSSTKDFETTYNGNVYILHVYSHVGSGDLMPRDYADDRIREILENRNIAVYEQSLVKALYQRALDDGRLTTVSYDPVEHKYLKQLHYEDNNTKK